MLTSFLENSMVSIATRWLQSLAGSFASVSFPLVAAALLAALYLLSKGSKKLKEKIGIGIGPIIAVALLAAAFFSLQGGLGGSRRLNGVLPPGVVKKAAEADASRAANAGAEHVMDNITASTPTGGAAAVPMLAFPNLPSVPHMPTPLHGTIVRHETGRLAIDGPAIHHFAAMPAARGGQVSSAAHPAHSGIIAPPPGWDAAPAGTAAAVVISGGDAKSISKPAADKTSPSGATPVADAAQASRVSSAKPATGNKPDRTKVNASGSFVAPATTAPGGITPPATVTGTGTGRTMAEEIAHTREMKRQRQGLAAGSGMPGGNATGNGGGVGGATGGVLHAPPANAAAEAAHTLAMRQKHKQSHAGGQMPHGSDISDWGGGFAPFAGGGVPFQPSGHVMGGGQHHAGSGNAHHAGNAHPVRRP